MFDAVCLSVVLAVGQGSPTTGASVYPVPGTPTVLPGTAILMPPAPPPAVYGRSFVSQPGALPEPATPGPAPRTADQPALKAEPKKNGNGNGEQKNGNGDKKDEEKKDEEKKDEKKEEPGYFMRTVKGTYLGTLLEAKDVVVSGWLDFSYNVSTRNVTNLPYTWNDRADTALLQQFWVNVEKANDWSKNEVQQGWKIAYLYGSDYRFTLIRGFLNNQLKNSNPDPRELNGFEQNIYGSDLPIFQYNVFLPGIGGEGTEITVGRMFCQFGYESVMATATPFMSRSYAFNWAPPFFHMGVMATTKVDKNLTVKNMIINGNDVFFDGSQEWRYSGVAALTSDDGNTAIIAATSLGRGQFNPNRPNGPVQGITTIGLAYEPAGRNNMNVFDLVLTQKVNDQLSFAAEGIYGYQTNVPAAATGSAANFGGTNGTAHWMSAVGYAFYNFSDKWTGQARFETFYDAEGQRTGFEGTYYSATLGLICKPCADILIRPEIRYDCNPYSRPFTGRHDILVAGFDTILKF